jgi:hypothetical protein
MLSDHDRETLDEIQHQLTADDPESPALSTVRRAAWGSAVQAVISDWSRS